MKKSRLALALLAPLSFAAAVPCVFADQFRLPKKLGASKHLEICIFFKSSRLFSMKITTQAAALNATSSYGNTLPAGAQIPDTDLPVPPVGPHGAVPGMKSAPQAVPSTVAPAVITGSGSMSSGSADLQLLQLPRLPPVIPVLRLRLSSGWQRHGRQHAYIGLKPEIKTDEQFQWLLTRLCLSTIAANLFERDDSERFDL